jgi:hypothetical protein
VSGLATRAFGYSGSSGKTTHKDIRNDSLLQILVGRPLTRTAVMTLLQVLVARPLTRSFVLRSRVILNVLVINLATRT